MRIFKGGLFGWHIHTPRVFYHGKCLWIEYWGWCYAFEGCRWGFVRGPRGWCLDLGPVGLWYIKERIER